METKHVLTNRDISEQYRDIQLHLMINDFKGAFACWAFRQDNQYEYQVITKAIESYCNFLKDNYFTSKNKVVEMDYDLILKLTSEDLFESIPDILALNETKPDFISIGALSRNVFYHILRDKITQPL